MTNKCTLCKNKTICKYSEEYEKEFKELEKLDVNKMFTIILECEYYKNPYNEPTILYKEVPTTIDITSTDFYKNKCEGCPTYARIKNGETVVGDACSFCQNNKWKVICGD